MDIAEIRAKVIEAIPDGTDGDEIAQALSDILVFLICRLCNTQEERLDRLDEIVEDYMKPSIKQVKEHLEDEPPLQ